MAASGKKKIIQQEELRRLMKAKQRETAAKKRIESPLAKYNNLGQLSCVVCNVQIKSELLWQAHILGKQHKEKVAELKGTKVKASSESGPTQLSQIAKRKGSVLESLESKRIKDSEDQSSTSTTSTLPPGFFETGDQPSPKPTAGKVPSVRLLPGDYDDDDDDDEEEKDGENVPSSTQQSMEIPLPPPTAQSSGLPPGFFDSKTPVVSHSGSILKADIQEKPVVERKENTAEALPEGFFDDPEVDAKVRKVDAPKDHLDKEWEEFQKEMRQVNTASEAIVAEEDEEGRLDRQIEEIDEQMECYRRIEDLRKRKDVLHDALKESLKEKSDKDEEDDVGSDDDILATMLTQSWREKGVFL